MPERMIRAEYSRVLFKGKKGILFSVSGAALFVTGLVRGELAATVCGAALVSWSLFALVAVLSVYLAKRKTELSLEWLKPDSVRLHILPNTAARRFFVLGFLPLPAQTLLSVRYETMPGMSFSHAFTTRIPAMESGTIDRAETPPRGYYQCVESRLVVSDYSGFFALSRRLDNAGSSGPLLIRPEPEKPASGSIPPGKTGDTRGKSTFRRSDELYETRPYSPGDDIRKIHWKVFAHSGELSLRQGELLPPPANEYYFCINTSPADFPKTGLSAKTGERLFESLVSRALYIADILLSRKHPVTFLYTNSASGIVKQTVLPGSPDAAEKARFALAQPQLGDPVPEPQNLLAQVPRNAPLLYFSLPGIVSAPPSAIAYIGPEPECTAGNGKKSWFTRLARLVLIEKNETPPSTCTALSHAIDETCRKLGREGISAEKI